jgi:predicted MFS family arabinose efflux permease
MLVTVTTLYFIHVEHITAATVGLVLSVAGGVGIAVVALSGRLVRILGQRRALATAYNMTAGCYCGYLFIHGIPGLLILVVLGEGGFLLAQPIRIALARGLAADHAEDCRLSL